MEIFRERDVLRYTSSTHTDFHLFLDVIHLLIDLIIRVIRRSEIGECVKKKFKIYILIFQLPSGGGDAAALEMTEVEYRARGVVGVLPKGFAGKAV